MVLALQLLRKLQASLEVMQLEIECSGNPLNVDYEKLGPLSTEGWVKAVWERALHYSYIIILNYPTERPPCKGDCNLMTIFLESSKPGKELISLK
jgi:hypothetical protein